MRLNAYTPQEGEFTGDTIRGMVRLAAAENVPVVGEVDGRMVICLPHDSVGVLYLQLQGEIDQQHRSSLLAVSDELELDGDEGKGD